MAEPGPVAAPAPAPRARGRRRLRRLLLLGVVALYAVSIPWYRAPGAEAPLWLGLPSWVTTAVLCYAGASVLNALAWFVTDFEDDEESA